MRTGLYISLVCNKPITAYICAQDRKTTETKAKASKQNSNLVENISTKFLKDFGSQPIKLNQPFLVAFIKTICH